MPLETTKSTPGRALRGGGEPTPFRGRAWWEVAFLPLPAVIWFLPPGAPVEDLVTAATPSRLPYGLLLGVSVMGLVLAEQIFRRAREQARWSIKPLCLGLGGGFFFDLYMYADALLFGHLDAT
jgi:hypothetical protein